METILNQSEANLKSILKKAHSLRKLNELLQQFLPSPLKTHCQIANYYQDSSKKAEKKRAAKMKESAWHTVTKVIIATDSAAWNMVLQFYLPTLLGELQLQGLSNLEQLESFIQPVSSHTPPRPSAPKLSAQSSAALTLAAKYCKDPGLSEALNRLAKNC